MTNYETSKKANAKKFQKMFKTLLKNGIFIAPSQFEVVFLSDAHTENDLNKALDAYHLALKSVKKLKYVVGARGSQLSIAQTNLVIDELKKVHPDTEYEIKTITTKGDTDSRPLFTIDQKGIFEKEIDRAVAQKEVDFAVHSLKDVPSELDENLVLACIPKRETVNDVFISPDGSTLDSIKSGSVVGTVSLRRAVQVSRKRPDVTVKPIRGNIETRIKKASEKTMMQLF